MANMKPTILGLTPLAIALVLTGCKTSKTEVPATEESAPLVSTVVVEERIYSPTLSFTGTAFANREANLGATLPGKVEKIYFDEGQNVHEGDLIVELSDELLTQTIIENETIKKDFDRVSRLREKGSISEMEYDHVKAQFEASQAKVQMVKKNTRVYAPFSGMVVERMMEEGEVYFLNPGLEPGYSMRSGIVRLMQLNPVKVRFDVNEKDLGLIRKGLEVEVTFDGVAGKTYHGKVETIKQILSTTTHSATVEVTISNPQLEIKPGMFAYITVKLPEVKAPVVPLKSIYRLPGTSEDYLFSVANDTINRIPISRLESIGEYVAVKGIEPGIEVVLDGKTRVSQGQRVRISSK